jgi:formylglycine-generating enzyme required for sulfatase activity
VTLERPVYMGVMEVTNADFRRFRSEHSSGYLDKEKRSFDLDAQPVSRVSWDDAVEYCNWLSEQEGLPPAYERKREGYVLKRPVTTGYRLPTEAEWEYAARYAGPGRTNRYAWGDALPITGIPGNLAGVEATKVLPAVMPGYRDEYPSLAPVGKFPPNVLGLHDMSGNVSEWVNDYYLAFVDDVPETDPLGPDDGARHVVRGANWQTASVAELRLAWRDGATGASQTLGFRVARYAE